MDEKKRYARLNEAGKIVFAPPSLTAQQLVDGGYLEYAEKERPAGPYSYRPVYSESGGKVERDWEAYPNYAEIDRLGAELAATDYKVIKCYELSLVGGEIPYDISGLHAARQELRDRINEQREAGNNG
jgi:hypothetical protein